jgi:hypothetical protein
VLCNHEVLILKGNEEDMLTVSLFIISKTRTKLVASNRKVSQMYSMAYKFSSSGHKFQKHILIESCYDEESNATTDL